MAKNKTKDPSAAPKCSVCDGKKKIPNPEGGKKITCPYCNGTGEELKNNPILEEDEFDYEPIIENLDEEYEDDYD